MAEMVSSAIVGETVNRIMSSITGKDEEKSKQKENIERLEMAYIKMEAVLQVSERWHITEVPLIRWQNKLKRAAQECDDTLLKCKQCALEEDKTRKRIRQSSFPKRIAHATKSLISSFIGANDESSSSSTNVRRFERYAEGANEFLKTVEFGGTPRRHTFFNPLIRHLFTGNSIKYQAIQDDKLYYLNIQPFSPAERGVEALFGFTCQDLKDATEGFYVACMLRLSESTDMHATEEIINLLLKWHIPLPDQDTNNKSSTVDHGQSSSQTSHIPTLKLGVLVIPHESSQETQPAAESYALQVIDGKEGVIHTNAHLRDLGEELLPKAIEYLHQNSIYETYQMSLKSRHGTAHICLEKSSINIQSAIMVQREATTHAQNKMATMRLEIEQWKQVSEDLLKLWVVRTSDKLQRAIMTTRTLA